MDFDAALYQLSANFVLIVIYIISKFQELI